MNESRKNVENDLLKNWPLSRKVLYPYPPQDRLSYRSCSDISAKCITLQILLI